MKNFPPLKRLAILERRNGDSREFFAQHWYRVHGGMVARLPYLAAYIQNHIVEDFEALAGSIRADGFVEQLWWSSADMQRGYTSSVVAELVADEVNYLGHGSNYAILSSEPLRMAEAGEKLIVAVRHSGDIRLVDRLENAGGEVGRVVRDDVVATIPKANMLPVQPQSIDSFLHIYCSDEKAASASGRHLSGIQLDIPPGAAVGLWRVRTASIIPLASRSRTIS